MAALSIRRLTRAGSLHVRPAGRRDDWAKIDYQRPLNACPVATPRVGSGLASAHKLREFWFSSNTVDCAKRRRISCRTTAPPCRACPIELDVVCAMNVYWRRISLSILFLFLLVGKIHGQFPNAIGRGAFPNTTQQIPPTAQMYPNAAGILSPRAQYRSYLYMLRRYYQQRFADTSVGPSWAFIMSQIEMGIYPPVRAENGDWLGRDNDFDGAVEPVYVRGSYRDGEYVRRHYRALPGYGRESEPSRSRVGY